MDQKPQETPDASSNTDASTTMPPTAADAIAPKNHNKMKYGPIACILLALIGIGFCAYGMLQNSANNKNTLEQQLEITTESHVGGPDARTDTNSTDPDTTDPYSNDTEPVSIEAIAEKAENDMMDGDSISIADAQSFLNEKLQLPLHSFVFTSSGVGVKYGENLLRYESSRATLIQSLAAKQGLSQWTIDDTCQQGAYITTGSYKEIYRKIFGRSFEHKDNVKYGQIGRFRNVPCSCDCAEEVIENGYYVWNNTYIPYPEINFTVEKVEGGIISGVITRADDGVVELNYEVKGNFTIEYGHNEFGYYIIDMSLME